ncbi:MAG: ribosome maturation factor RimP [Bacteroidota bacterium]|jgi:ribosome maturation factor RimP
MVLKEQIESIVKEWIGTTDRFLVEVKTSTSKVAVYVDKPIGITLSECAELSRLITDRLDADGVWESHELEVSSPGMDQPLRVYQQYLRRIGRQARVVTSEGREHKGVIGSADETGFELVETVSKKQNKTKTITETRNRFGYDKIKETKLILTFKNN